MILAPLRGVTIRCFRETFAEVIRDAGFTEAITPFIAAMPGYDPMRNEELRIKNEECAAAPQRSTLNAQHSTLNTQLSTLKVTPQFIGKDPEALRRCLERVKEFGYDTADLNCGCPYPMVRNKGRGSGILRTPDVLRRMLEVGCETMGPCKFSVKARLGVDRPDELLKLMPMINEFPLRFLTVHARTARQMYEGSCDVEMVEAVRKISEVPLVYNGDVEFCGTASRGTGVLPIQTVALVERASRPFGLADAGRTGETPVPHAGTPVPQNGISVPQVMIGRSFVRYLGQRDDARELLERYIAASRTELCGDRPVLGRMKELLAYWKDLPAWKRRWPVLKLCRSVDELRAAI